MLNMSAAECLEFALRLVASIGSFPRDPKERPDWTEGNLEALYAFVESDYVKSRFPDPVHYLARKHDFPARKIGEYLSFDYSVYVPSARSFETSPAGRGFLIFAESEFHKSLDGIKADFEKLLYVRAPCKVMMCWASQPSRATVIAKELSDYAHSNCNQFSPGEVYVLYFSNWGTAATEPAFLWQAPEIPSSESEIPFKFEPLELA